MNRQTVLIVNRFQYDTTHAQPEILFNLPNKSIF